MNLDRWVEACLGVVTVAVAYAALRGGRQANKAQALSESKAVDAAAYGRAQGIYEGAIKQLNNEVADLRAEVRNLRSSNAELAAEVTQLRNSNQQLVQELEHLRHS